MNEFFSNIEQNLKNHLQKVSSQSNDSPDKNEYNPVNEVSSFKLPIQYLDKEYIQTLPNNVKSDLEMIENSTSKDKKCMYDYLFLPSNNFGQNMIPNWASSFTNNTEFLEESKQILNSWNNFKGYSECDNDKKLLFLKSWKMIKKDRSFLERYSYIDWEPIKHLNKYPEILQILTILNISSPVLSLLLPIMFLIIPFFLLKLQRVPITFTAYIKVLKDIAKNHFIGKTLLNMTSLSFDKIFYFFITLGLYCLQVYQNMNACMKFYKNVKKINIAIQDVKRFSMYSIHNMEQYLLLATDKPNHRAFCDNVLIHIDVLKRLVNQINSIQPFTNSIRNYLNNGLMMKCFYDLYDSTDYNESLIFSMGFEGYIDNMCGIHKNIQTKLVSFADFDGGSPTTFDKQFYPPLITDNMVKNDVTFGKNMIISSPNRSGKTTILKSVTLNIILSQQLGCGFYNNAIINPYTHIHSYLNIPDTSERDSLFQAESRRCKDIIDIISNNGDTSRHFCIFDELYSGTNPEEATKAGTVFIDYLSKRSNVDFILTTHYFKICRQFRKSCKIDNYKMDVKVLENGEFLYKYRLHKGISKLKGAIRVLKDLNYPEEILKELE